MQKLTKQFKLLNSKDYSYVFSKPNKLFCQNLTVFARKNQYQTPRLGLAIAKKAVKKAFCRNRIKRIIRESFRQNRAVLPNVDIVFMAKKSASIQSNTVLQKELVNLWKKLNSLFSQ